MKPITIERIVKTKLKTTDKKVAVQESIKWYDRVTKVGSTRAKSYINSIISFYDIDIVDLTPSMTDDNTAYAKKQEWFVKKYNIHSGDSLRVVLDCRNLGTGWNGGNGRYHRDLVGRIVKLESIGSTYFNINGNGWPYWAFEKVEIDKTSIVPELYDTTEDYARKQALWLEKNNVNVGDRVKIIQNKNIGTGWSGGWTNTMYNLNIIGVIHRTNSNSISVYFADTREELYCPYFLFEVIHEF